MGKRDNSGSKSERILSFFYPTSDDWAPNFPRDCVEVSLSVYTNPNQAWGIKEHGRIRIVVGGADDRSMERDCIIEDEAERLAKVAELKYWLEHKLPNPITQDWLAKQGFR